MKKLKTQMAKLVTFALIHLTTISLHASIKFSKSNKILAISYTADTDTYDQLIVKHRSCTQESYEPSNSKDDIQEDSDKDITQKITIILKSTKSCWYQPDSGQHPKTGQKIKFADEVAETKEELVTNYLLDKDFPPFYDREHKPHTKSSCCVIS